MMANKHSEIGQYIFKKQDSIKIIAWLSSLLSSLQDDKKYIITINQHRERRSLDANAYCWVLIDKLSIKTGCAKTDIYRHAIREIGGNCDIVCVPNNAVKKLCECWEKHGTGWQAETTKSKIDGCTNVILYYGSSTYDSKQMACLIDSIVQECREAGIETMTPAELQSLKDRWK